MEAETVGSIWSVDESNKISPLHALVSDHQQRNESSTHDVVDEFLKNCPALFLGQRSHYEDIVRGTGGMGGRRSSSQGEQGSRDPALYIFAEAGSRSGGQISCQNEIHTVTRYTSNR